MIYVAFDTNILHLPKTVSFGEFHLNSKFDRVVEMINGGRTRDTVKILLPEIVLKELWKQRCDDYDSVWNTITSNVSLLGDDVKVRVHAGRDAYSTRLSNQIEKYIKQFPFVEKIPFCASEYFQEIIQRAILKEPPFEGKEKTSDKGFKDTVLYYSLLDYAKKHPGEYYLLEQDRRFTTDEGRKLRGYFRKQTGQTIVFLDNVEALDVELIDEKGTFIDNATILESCEQYSRGNRVHEPIMKVSISKNQLEDNGRNTLKRINRDIESYLENKKLEWDSVILDPGPYWPNMEFEGKIDTDITFNRSGILGLLFKSYTYIGGIHGGREYVGMTYDLNSGRRVHLIDLLGVSEDVLTNRVNAAILADMEKGDYDYFEGYKPCFSGEEEINYYLDEEGVKIILGEYEAGAYAAGIHHVLLTPIDNVRLPTDSGEQN